MNQPIPDPVSSSAGNSAASATDFVAYIGRLYDLAVGYGGTRDPNQLVMEFLRHEDYADHQWHLLLGELDRDFVMYALSSGIRMIRQVRDPCHGIDLKVSHFGAACNGAFLEGLTPGSGVNRGDLTGWGGDWITFYGEWRRDSAEYPSGYAYCRQRLGRTDVSSTFKMRDLLEDADGHNIGTRLRAGGNIADEVRAVFRGGGCFSRLRRFHDGRFGGAATAAATAAEMLTSGGDLLVDAGRAYLIESTGGMPTLLPDMLPGKELEEFCRGFSDMLTAAVGQENASASAARTDGKGRR